MIRCKYCKIFSEPARTRDWRASLTERCNNYSKEVIITYKCPFLIDKIYIYFNWAVTCDFKQCGILTSVDSDEPAQLPFKLRNSKWCTVSSLTVIEYCSDWVSEALLVAHTTLLEITCRGSIMSPPVRVRSMCIHLYILLSFHPSDCPSQMVSHLANTTPSILARSFWDFAGVWGLTVIFRLIFITLFRSLNWVIFWRSFYQSI